ncbi:hypothetical protein KY366_05410 [Candidatus Woesearchaeota archaeon]|nr:hypothetical protein [Candidatus Woesearchaeota archaeon]
MAIEEYTSAVIPVFVTLGSLGALYPYFVEGFIIFSFVLLIALFALEKFFERIKLRGYYNIFLASISVIFALSYFQKLNLLLVLSGILVLGFAIYTIFIATIDIKCGC